METGRRIYGGVKDECVKSIVGNNFYICCVNRANLCRLSGILGCDNAPCRGFYINICSILISVFMLKERFYGGFMNKNVWWAWAIQNTISVICWVVLAIVSNKWWVALFGLLFISGFKQVQKHCRVCDKCGKHSPYADNYNEALNKAKEAGWIHYVDGNKDYCPDCQKEGI